jgi:hypothetical protein
MQQRGFFIAWRKTIFDEELGMGKDHNRKDIPYSAYEAWMWLLATAVYEPKTFPINGADGKLDTGQLSYSYRYLAKAWKWDKTSVAKFLKRLEVRGAIKMQTRIHTNLQTMSRTLITICNYKSYQKKFIDPNTNGETTLQTKSQNNKKSINQEIKKKRERLTAAMAAHPLAVWIKENAPRVAKMDNPLTNTECDKLIQEFSKEQLESILLSMDNWKPLLSKNKSANLTIRKWIKMENERTAKNNPSQAVYVPYKRRG